MRSAIAISAAAHLAVMAVAWAGVPALFRRDPPEDPPIIVELVAIDEVTRAAPEVVKPKEQPAKEEEPPPPPEPKPEVAATPPPPPPPPPAPKPAPEPEKVAALPPPPAPEPKPAPPPPPPPETRSEPEPPKPPPRPVDVRPKTKPTPPARAPKFDAERIAVLIDKSRKDEPQPEEPKEEAKSFLQPPPKQDAPVRRAELGNRLTISEIDAIRFQIEQCWSVPAGARDAQDLIIRIHISLKPDGSLKAPPEVLDRDRLNDGFFRAAAESATRAIQRCTPLKNLPTAKYDRWQEITLTFNPRELLGG